MNDAMETLDYALNQPVFAEAALRPELYDIFAFHQYPFMSLMFFLSLYVLAKMTNKGFEKYFGKVYTDLDIDKQRIAVTYVLEIMVTSGLLIVMTYGSKTMLFVDYKETSHEETQAIMSGVHGMVALYTFELVYRVSFGIPLLVHHMVTIALAHLIACCMYERPSINTLDIMRANVLMAYTAITEQPSFIALLLYRMKMNEEASKWFYFAAIQSAVTKSILIVSALYYFCISPAQFGRNGWDGWSILWSIIWIPLCLCLYATQIYACVVLYRLGKKAKAKMLSMEMNDGDSVIKDMDDSKKDSSAQLVDNVSDTEFLSHHSC